MKGPSVVRTITDVLPAGTVSLSSSITDEAPEAYFHGTREEYEKWLETVRTEVGLRPSHQADLIAGAVEPEETFQEYMERHSD
jgi:hypothetical protein